MRSNDVGRLVAVLLLIMGRSNATLVRAQVRIDSSFKLGFVHSPLTARYVMDYSFIEELFALPDGKILAEQNLTTYDTYRSNKSADEWYGFCRYNSDGSLDRILNDSGRVPDMSYVGNLLYGQDYKLYRVSGNQGDITISKFRYNYLLDSSFGNNGTLYRRVFGHANFGTSVDRHGYFYNACKAQDSVSTDMFGVLRLLPDGSDDTTFGTGGHVMTYGGRWCGGAYNTIPLADGRIIMWGGGDTDTGSGDFAVARYLHNGRLDSTFGTNGLTFSDFGTFFDDPHDAALQPDGKIVVVGEAGYDMLAIARYLPDGRPDTSFNHTGQLTADAHGLPLRGKKVIVMPNGKILVGCAAYLTPSGNDQNLAVFRCTADGRPDTEFAPDGVFVIDFGYDDVFRCIALQPDGGILLGGNAVDGTDWQNPVYHREFVRLVVNERDEAPGASAQIYPNPVGPVLYIRSADSFATATLYDMLGRVVLRQTITASPTQISVAALPPGPYILRLYKQAGAAFTQTVIKR